MNPNADLRSLIAQALAVVTRSRTYLNLLYLAVSLPLALIYVVVLLISTVSGVLLSVVGIGLLILVGGLTAALGFARLERELASSLLGIDLPPPQPLPPGSVLRRLRTHLTRADTWKSLLYLVLKLPFGLFTYALASLVLVPGLSLTGTMVRDLAPGPNARLESVGAGLLGLALLLAALHGANFLARLWGLTALAILGPSERQRQLWAAQQRAAQADHKRRELIVNVSHELRTPLASIQGHLDSLLMPAADRPPGVDPEQYLSVASAETKRLSTLVNELLELARADRSELAMTIRPIDVVPIARKVALAIAPIARQERQVTVVTPDGASATLAIADADRLAQVLSNLVRNAVNHTPAGGAVQVHAEADGDDVIIAVNDTGSGIAPDELERIFERFYRTDAGRSRDAGGFGLGLSIARELVEAMGGTLTATSELGVGSTFRVRLRRAGQ